MIQLCEQESDRVLFSIETPKTPLHTLERKLTVVLRSALWWVLSMPLTQRRLVGGRRLHTVASGHRMDNSTARCNASATWSVVAAGIHSLTRATALVLGYCLLLVAIDTSGEY